MVNAARTTWNHHFKLHLWRLLHCLLQQYYLQENIIRYANLEIMFFIFWWNSPCSPVLRSCLKWWGWKRWSRHESGQQIENISVSDSSKIWKITPQGMLIFNIAFTLYYMTRNNITIRWVSTLDPNVVWQTKGRKQQHSTFNWKGDIRRLINVVEVHDHLLCLYPHFSILSH